MVDGRTDATDTMVLNWKLFVNFYDLPAEYWMNLRTTSLLESVFSAVRLRTDVA